jgi:hypothetical protein
MEGIINTPSVPNYWSVLIGTQRYKGILRLDMDLNKLSNEVFCIQNGAISKMI